MSAPAVHAGVEVVVLHSTVSEEGLVLPHQVSADERDLVEEAGEAEAGRRSDDDEHAAPAPARLRAGAGGARDASGRPLRGGP